MVLRSWLFFIAIGWSVIGQGAQVNLWPLQIMSSIQLHAGCVGVILLWIWIWKNKKIICAVVTSDGRLVVVAGLNPGKLLLRCPAVILTLYQLGKSSVLNWIYLWMQRFQKQCLKKGSTSASIEGPPIYLAVYAKTSTITMLYYNIIYT